MKKIVTIISALMFVAAIGVVGSACGGDETLTGTSASGAPNWVLKGSGAFTGDRGKAFYGVGSAPKMIDVSMQRDRANNRARRQILQIFNTYIAYMMKDYARSTTAGDMSKESYEADVLKATRRTCSRYRRPSPSATSTVRRSWTTGKTRRTARFTPWPFST
jgi:hypothetical protein